MERVKLEVAAPLKRVKLLADPGAPGAVTAMSQLDLFVQPNAWVAMLSTTAWIQVKDEAPPQDGWWDFQTVGDSHVDRLWYQDENLYETSGECRGHLALFANTLSWRGLTKPWWYWPFPSDKSKG